MSVRAVHKKSKNSIATRKTILESGQRAKALLAMNLPASGVAAIRASLGATQQRFSSLVGISLRKISALERGEQKPSADDQRRLNELRRLGEALEHLIAPSAIADWIQTPNEYLGDQSPAQLIEKGEADRLWRLIWRLQDNVPLD